MRCVFCSFEFDEESSQRPCSGCFRLGNCSMVKCPRCGYETPPEPRWLRRIKKRSKKGDVK